MISLVLAIACSLGVGVVFKIAGARRVPRIELLAANYLAAAALAVALIYAGGGADAGLSASPGLILLGVVTGALFIAGFFLLSLATEVAGMGLAIGVMRVSVVVPFLASWWLWGEVPTAGQGAGLVLAGVAFFLIATRRSPEREAQSTSPPDGAAKTFAVLALVFIAGGATDTMMKTFDELFAADSSRSLFLLLVFAVAFIIGVMIRIRDYRQGARPDALAIGLGVVLGWLNYGSVHFLLAAIRLLSGPFVFPANNISIVIGAAIIGVVVWNERLSRMNWIGIALASIALLLLNY